MRTAPRDGTLFVFRRTDGVHSRLEVARWRGEEPREIGGRIFKREPGWVGQDEHCSWIIRDNEWLDRFEWSSIAALTSPGDTEKTISTPIKSIPAHKAEGQ